jgi:hypothetical protein
MLNSEKMMIIAKGEKMLTVQEKSPASWSSLQEPVCASKFPSAYLRLLSALENGWYILHTELDPSWDQTGFIYRVQLQQKDQERTEELVDEILEQYSSLECIL